MTMTDGCGWANRFVMRELHNQFPEWSNEPTAIQCRLGGAKGLLLVNYDLPNDEPMIFLRPSQIKIKYSAAQLQECILPKDIDPAMLTIDVLRASRMSSPARLSVETIMNLAENGVPDNVFQDLFRVDVEERLDRLLNTEREDALFHIWTALEREGGVMRERMARQAAGKARAAGYVFEDANDLEWDEDGLNDLDAAIQVQSTAWWEDPVSGCPSTLEETCMELLDSGFTFQNCAVLLVKHREVCRKALRSYNAKYRFSVPMSCSAFIVPGTFV